MRGHGQAHQQVYKRDKTSQGMIYLKGLDVDVRTSKPIENFYEFISLFEPNRGHTWKQDPNRLRKILPRMDLLFFLYAWN